MRGIDPITFQVISTGLTGIVREMQLLLFRTGYSTAIRESQDASCAILDRQGNLVAQFRSLYMHMGIFRVMMDAVFERYPVSEMEQGDVFILNHPYHGGSTHVSDMGVIVPVFYHGEHVAFCASMAHKTDVGGVVPGSASGQATEIYQEGLLLPPLKYVSHGCISQEIETILKANSRTPEVLIGDIRGQIGVCRIGEDRIGKLMDKYGQETILWSFQETMDRTERSVKHGIGQWPDGSASMEAFLDPDGILLYEPVKLHLTVTKKGESLIFDFTGCDDQTRSPVNVKQAATISAAYFAVIAMIDPTIPNNEGLAHVVQGKFRPGSVVSPLPPTAVSCYTVPLTTVLEMAISIMGKIAGQKAIACSGRGANVTMGGKSLMTGKPYIQYELGGASCGAVDGDDGCAGHHIRGTPGHVKSVPLEIVESEFACRMLRYGLTLDSGGPGKFCGGPGWVKEYLILDEQARLGLRANMFVFPAWGVNGGLPGKPGSAVLNPGTLQEKILPPRLADFRLKKGDILWVECGGGGGVGKPAERPKEKVIEDVENGYITPHRAREVFGTEVREECSLSSLP